MLGVPNTDGIPIVAKIVVIPAEFAPVVVPNVTTVPPNATNASVFADILRPCPTNFISCKVSLYFKLATLPDKSFILLIAFCDKSCIFPDKSVILLNVFCDKSLIY